MLKYSRNPETGIVEVYTDDGAYLGNVSSMGDVVTNDLSVEDGGLGSGNWGTSREQLPQKADDRLRRWVLDLWAGGKGKALQNKRRTG